MRWDTTVVTPSLGTVKTPGSGDNYELAFDDLPAYSDGEILDLS